MMIKKGSKLLELHKVYISIRSISGDHRGATHPLSRYNLYLYIYLVNVVISGIIISAVEDKGKIQNSGLIFVFSVPDFYQVLPHSIAITKCAYRTLVKLVNYKLDQIDCSSLFITSFSSNKWITFKVIMQLCNYL